ncbi:MAG: cytochrome c [Roseibium sp.]|nr:cytochrome c [Roseibium sp.]
MVAGTVLLSGGLILWQQNRQSARPEPHAGPMIAVSRPDLSKVELDGEIAFQANCATCHGDKADGRNGIGPPLVHKIYEPGHHADGAFYLAVKQGVRAHHWTFGNMPPVATVTETDVDNIVGYVRALQRANGIY